MINLRDYQLKCVDEMLKVNEGDKTIVELPTGAGKTIIVSELANRSQGRILMTVPSTELREQTLDKMKLVCGDDIDIGSVQGIINEVSNKIVIATRQSLTHKKSNRIEKMLDNGDFEYLIIDECHQAIEQIEKIINKLNKNIKIIGMTATPYNKAMSKVFNKCIYKRTLLEMIQEKYLVEPRAIQVNSTTDISVVKSVGGEFVQADLERTVNNDERNDIVIQAYKDYLNNRKHTIVFASGINHSNSLANSFNKVGISAKSIDSSIDNTEREKILSEFKQGKFKVLVNVSILTTGFDFPEVDSLILARPTKSKILYVQCLGRALRLAENKNDALILDIVDIASKFDLINISDIFDININNGETPTEAIIRKQQADEKQKQKEEFERIEKERKEQEKLELIAQEIKLFNQDFNAAFSNSYLHWFRYNDFTYCISATITLNYVIKEVEENTFIAYKFDKEDKYNPTLEDIETSNNLHELIHNIENLVMQNSSNYSNRYAKWKYNPITENQLKYIKAKNKFMYRTKWDAHCYFTNCSLYYALKDLEEN